MKKTINLTLTETELEHLKWALTMDVDVSDDHLREKRTLLARLKRVRTNGPSGEEVKNESLAYLELSVRATNALHDSNIKTVGDLLKCTEIDLLRMANMGRKGIDEIKARLDEDGLALATMEAS